MTTNLFNKCLCDHCNGHIEFPPESAGQDIDCPHCGMTTSLRTGQHPQSVPPHQISSFGLKSKASIKWRRILLLGIPGLLMLVALGYALVQIWRHLSLFPQALGLLTGGILATILTATIIVGAVIFLAAWIFLPLILFYFLSNIQDEIYQIRKRLP